MYKMRFRGSIDEQQYMDIKNVGVFEEIINKEYAARHLAMGDIPSRIEEYLKEFDDHAGNDVYEIEYAEVYSTYYGAEFVAVLFTYARMEERKIIHGFVEIIYV